MPSPVIEIDRDTTTVKVDGRPIEPTATEWAILVCLAESPGRFYREQEINEAVWGRPDGYARWHIQQGLREKGVTIENRRGFGYRLGEDAIVNGDALPYQPSCSGHRLCSGVVIFCDG